MIFFNLGILFKQIILVLDLNEILSYLSKDTNKIYLRPSLREFLQNLPSYYELIVVTSENKDYAEQIIDFLEIEQKNLFIIDLNKSLFILMKKI